MAHAVVEEQKLARLDERCCAWFHGPSSGTKVGPWEQLRWPIRCCEAEQWNKSIEETRLVAI